jgi:hypothetical protein
MPCMTWFRIIFQITTTYSLSFCWCVILMTNESMLNYTIKCLWFRMELKMKYFLTKNKKVYSNFICISFWNHSVFHWVYIKLNTKFENFWNNKSREQILLNLTTQYGVQKYFFIIKLNEIFFLWIYKIKIIVYSKEGK